MPKRTRLVEGFDPDQSGFGFTVLWEYNEYHAHIRVFEVAMLSEGGEKHYKRLEAASSMDTVDRIDDAEPYLEGFVKWDGCAEFESSPHFCGVICFRNHAALFRYIWERWLELAPNDARKTW